MTKGKYIRTKEWRKEKSEMMKGRISHRKGKSMIEEYGEERARQLKENLRLKNLGKKQNLSEEEREKKRLRMLGDNNIARQPGIGKKISEATTGIKRRGGWKHSEQYKKEQAERVRGEKSPFKRSDVREKLKLAKHDGRREQWLINLRNERKNRDVKLNKNPNWKGGISFELYSLDFNKKLKDNICDLYLYKCFLCHKIFKKMNVHHIDYDKKNCKIYNLVLLCNSCHGKTNGNREYWKNKLSNGVKEFLGRQSLKNFT